MKFDNNTINLTYLITLNNGMHVIGGVPVK